MTDGWLGSNSVRFSPTHFAAARTDASAPSRLVNTLIVVPKKEDVDTIVQALLA